MPKILVSDNIYRLLYERAQREGKKFDALVNELLNKVLWNEPGTLFKGKYYQVSPDLFNTYEPKPGEIEE